MLLVMLLLACKIVILLGEEQWEKTLQAEAAKTPLEVDGPDTGGNKEATDNSDSKCVF